MTADELSLKLFSKDVRTCVYCEKPTTVRDNVFFVSPKDGSELEYHTTTNPVDPYQEYAHCPYDLGVTLIKIKGSLHRCPSCGGTFTD